MKRIPYRLYIVVGILGILAMLLFAANSYEEDKARAIKKYIEAEHSKLVPLNDSTNK